MKRSQRGVLFNHVAGAGVVRHLREGHIWCKGHCTIKEHVHDRARCRVGNGLDRGTGSRPDGRKVGRIGNGAVDIVELDRVAVIQFNQVQAGSCVVVPVLVHIIDIGVPGFPGRLLIEIRTNVVHQQRAGRCVVFIGNVIGEPGSGRRCIQRSQWCGPAYGVGRPCVIGCLVKGLSWRERHCAIKEHVHYDGCRVITVDFHIGDVLDREAGCCGILLGTRLVIIPVFRRGGLVPVIVAHGMDAIRVDRIVREENEFHTVRVTAIRVISVLVPRDDHGSLAGRILVYIGIGKCLGKAVRCLNLDRLSGIHAPCEIAEVPEVGPLHGTLVLLLDVGVLFRIPPEFLLNNRVRIIDKDRALVVIVGYPVAHDRQVRFQPLVGLGCLTQDSYTITGIFYDMNVCCCRYRGCNQQNHKNCQ